MSSDVKHDYHLVDPSPWPVIGSVFAFTMLVGAVFYMNKDYGAFGILAIEEMVRARPDTQPAEAVRTLLG